MNYQFFKQLEMLRILLDYVKKHSSSKQDSQYDAVKYFLQKWDINYSSDYTWKCIRNINKQYIDKDKFLQKYCNIYPTKINLNIDLKPIYTIKDNNFYINNCRIIIRCSFPMYHLYDEIYKKINNVFSFFKDVFNLIVLNNKTIYININNENEYLDITRNVNYWFSLKNIDEVLIDIVSDILFKDHFNNWSYKIKFSKSIYRPEYQYFIYELNNFDRFYSRYQISDYMTAIYNQYFLKDCADKWNFSKISQYRIDKNYQKYKPMFEEIS